MKNKLLLSPLALNRMMEAADARISWTTRPPRPRPSVARRKRPLEAVMGNTLVSSEWITRSQLDTIQLELFLKHDRVRDLPPAESLMT